MSNSFPNGGFDFNNPAESMFQIMDQLRSTFEKRAGTRMGRGDVRTAILALLTEEAMHGYQIIREIEQRSDGKWKPSAGSVYPTLQLLAEEGLIRAEESNGRKTYMLTDAGQEEASAAAEEAPWESTKPHLFAEHGALPKAGIDLAQAVA
ncbi:MAG: PadR family transcriptional regulator, partial [Microbacteriaceae bacterium]